jgi:conjugative transfer pilus assembly protein TraH
MTLPADQALKPRILAMIQSMDSKARNDIALDADEIGLLGATSVPLYKIISVNAAATFGGMTTENMGHLAEIVAIDLLDTFVQQNYSYVTRGTSNFQNVNEEALDQWRDQMREVRKSIQQYSMSMDGRLERTQYIVDRTMILERSLRNSLSPQLSGALSFGTSLSSQSLN